jgi:hypothetical protein
MSTAPRRPRYFSGQVLTAEDFEAEQSYHLEARRRDTRHLHGWGVVSGLAVTPSGSGGVVVEPGLAIDGMGRAIVIPEQCEMTDPRQPIDDRGAPCGPAVDCDTVTLCLAYAERPDEKTDPDRFVRETYVLEVRPGRAAGRETREPCEHCVPIATVHWRDGALRVAMRSRRTLVSTDALLELINGLVRRVHALEQVSRPPSPP